jgi:hypothetical protein
MYTKALPPFLLGETEWPEAITSGDLLFWIPIQTLYDGDNTTSDIVGNISISVYGSQPVTGYKQFKIQHNASLDVVNLLLNELFWDDATKTPKWIVHKELGTNYLGKNLLFQCTTGEPWSDLILFSTPRTSSTSPSIEQVVGYLQLTPGDIITFGGSTFTFGGRPIRF